MSDLREAASGLLSAVEAAIESGDWKVDGACDPHVEIIRLKNILARPEQEPVKEPFNSKTGVKEAFNLDRGCWERGCVAYDERDGDGVNISAERVDETAKREHEPYPEGDVVGPCICGSWPGGKCLKCKRIEPPKREWVGLTVDEARKFYEKYTDREELIYAIDKFLEDKNA